MSVSSRLASLEKKHGGLHGECRCDGGSPKLLFCREPSVPAPPPRLCDRCGRVEPRLIVQAGPPLPGEVVESGPAYQAFDNLRDFYIGTVRRRPAYEYVSDNGLRAMMGGLDPGGVT